jgi:hypothetical protein
MQPFIPHRSSLASVAKIASRSSTQSIANCKMQIANFKLTGVTESAACAASQFAI